MRQRIATRAVHAGRTRDPHTGDVVPAIHLSTTFERDDDGRLIGDYIYSRDGNPNRQALERCIAELEGGVDAACFASGSAAANAVLQCLRPGDRVLYGTDLYYGTRSMMNQITARAGVHCAEVDLADPAALDAALRDDVRLIWCESPGNPLLRIVDLAAVASRARRAGVAVLVDNTFATPICQRPLGLGADLVLHATTKFLGGHSDVVGGAVVAADADQPLWQAVRVTQRLAGGVLAPFDSWLTLRGIATLAIRMRAHQENARDLAHWLVERPEVERVHYPGLASHPGHAVAARQMSGFGGVLSFQVRGGETATRRFMAGLRLMHRATSLGGVHSLIEHRMLVEPPESTVPRNLVRLSVGIEHVDDLREDLLAGFARLGA